MSFWNQKLALTAASAVVALCFIPSAAAERQLYVKALGGFGTLADADVSSRAIGDGEVEFSAGFNAGGAVGYDFGRWRLEGEILYRTNDVDDVSGTLFDGTDDGDFSALTLGANALYQFNLLKNPKVVSYAGAGVVWFQEVDLDFETAGVERSYSGDDFALQLIAGARYDLAERWALTAEVRHLFGGEVELDGEGAAVGSIDADYDQTSLVLGLSYRF